MNFVLRFRWLTLIAALLVMAATVYPFKKLGKEFMPPLNEGDILYMPTAVPGMSIEEADKDPANPGPDAAEVSRSGKRLWQSRPVRNAHRSRAAFDV